MTARRFRRDTRFGFTPPNTKIPVDADSATECAEIL